MDDQIIHFRVDKAGKMCQHKDVNQIVIFKILYIIMNSEKSPCAGILVFVCLMLVVATIFGFIQNFWFIEVSVADIVGGGSLLFLTAVLGTISLLAGMEDEDGLLAFLGIIMKITSLGVIIISLVLQPWYAIIIPCAVILVVEIPLVLLWLRGRIFNKKATV